MGRNDLRGRLNGFQDILVAGATFISLYQGARDVYTATVSDQSRLKAHLTESLKSGFRHDIRLRKGRPQLWFLLDCNDEIQARRNS